VLNMVKCHVCGKELREDEMRNEAWSFDLSRCYLICDRCKIELQDIIERFQVFSDKNIFHLVIDYGGF